MSSENGVKAWGERVLGREISDDEAKALGIWHERCVPHTDRPLPTDPADVGSRQLIDGLMRGSGPIANHPIIGGPGIFGNNDMNRLEKDHGKRPHKLRRPGGIQ